MSTPTLYDILSQKLEQKRKDHPSFRLMKIDDRLFPNAQTKHSTLVLEARNSNNELKTVKEIIAESWKKGNKNHLMIEGEGGIGKTVTLLNIPDKFTPSPKPFPSIYIPLHELKGDFNTMEKYIRKRVLSNKEDLFEQLLGLIDKPWDNAPQLLLLLDGFNEIAAENRQTISEDIKYWSEFQGIQIVTSSRYDIHTYVSLSYDYSTIKLQPLSDRTVEEYLNSTGVPIPVDNSAKKLITIPLLLTLYVQTALILEQRETDSSSFREVKNAGSIVWNYLQCELWRFGIEDEDAKNAIIAMEFIAPYMAWQMQQNSLFFLNQEQFNKFLEDAYNLLKNHFDKLTDFRFHIQDALQKADGIPPLKLIRSLLEKHLCLFVKNGEQYRLMHQQFRDALAAMHLINSIYLSGNSRPTEWNPIIDHYVMRFVADLISEKEANRLWEQNRKAVPAIEDATRNQLRLQGLLHNNNFSHLNFSGLDLSNISVYPFRFNKTTIILPTRPEKMYKTKISDKTFSPEGPNSSVTTVAMTPDGKRIVSGSWDGTIQVWDLETGNAIRTIDTGHGNLVSTVAVTPDGKSIVSGSWNRTTIYVWDMDTGTPIGNPINGHEGSVYAVAVTPDGKHIISGSGDKTIRVWDINKGTQVGNPIRGHKSYVTSVAVTPDGGRIVSGSVDQTIRVWDINKGTQIGNPIQGHKGYVTSVAVTPDGGRIVTSSIDHTIRVWDMETFAAIGNPLEGHQGGVTAVAMTPDGKSVVSGSLDRTIRVWNLETNNTIRKPIEGHEGRVNAVAVTPDGKRIVSVSTDQSIRVWNMENSMPIGTPIEGHKFSLTAIAVMPDGKHIVIRSSDQTIRVWNIKTGSQIGDSIVGHVNWKTFEVMMPDRTRVALYYNTIIITEFKTDMENTIKVHPLSFVGLDFSKAIISTPELKETLRQNGAKVDPD